MKKNDKRHADALKSAVSTLRQIQIAPCSAELYGKLDKIMYSLEEIIDELLHIATSGGRFWLGMARIRKIKVFPV